jgi:hypothetical protein
MGESERPANDPNETRRGCFLPDLTRVDKASVRRRPLDGYLVGRRVGGKAAHLDPRQACGHGDFDMLGLHNVRDRSALERNHAGPDAMATASRRK